MSPSRPGLCLVLALVFAAAPLAGQSGEGEVGLPLGTPAPPAAVEDLEGNPVELLNLVRGRPALIEFWATWCENCEALQPQLDEIQAQHGEAVAIVAVAVGVAQSVRRVRRRLEEHDPGYPYVWDGRGAAVRAYRAPTTSVVVMLDAEGKVVYTGSGARQDLKGAVGRLLLGQGP
jgi:cytochrome c biogenesis protein CcmG/thiol:disulfide interchange protein DsbE